MVGLVPRDSGELRLRDEELAPEVEERTREQLAGMRMVFQNPTASLNPKASHPPTRLFECYGSSRK